jgi:phage terminase large subunit
MNGFDRFIVEEAQTISDKSLKLLTPTLRTDNSEIWFIANPQSSADPLSQRFIVPFQSELDKNGYYEDDLHLIIVCNYLDNPFFPDVLEQERVHDFEHLSRAEYDHIWLGKFNDEVENSIIKPEWFDAAIDAHKIDRLKEVFKPHGAKVSAHDPFDGGNDAGGIAIRHGSIIEYVADKQTGEIDEVCDWATSISLQHGCDWFIWDGDGMGTGLKRQVSIALDGTRTQYQVFKGSLSGAGQDNAESIYLSEFSKAENTTYANTFKNNRAQYYIQLTDRFYNTYRCVEKGEYVDPEDMISLNSDGIENITALRSEICRIPRKLNNNGLYQIMSKQDMAKLGIKSPNMSDSVMMTMFKPKVKRQRKELKYQNLGLV